MAVNSQNKAELFKATVEEKIEKLIADFSAGQISREQFQAIYERYNSQLDLANQAIFGINPDALGNAETGPSTIAVRNALMGKATGMVIYHNSSGRILETLGDFEVEVSRLSKTLDDISMQMDEGKLIDRRVEKLASGNWLTFAAGKYTTIVTVFHNEPSEMQNREIERLHHDFEQANSGFISKEYVDSSKLAYPFLVFIRKKFKK